MDYNSYKPSCCSKSSKYCVWCTV